jgi:DNA-binding response OmpR family regulator
MEVLIKKKILVVIDNRDVCEILSFNLEHEGHSVSRAFSVEEAFQKLTPDCDLIMIDITADDKQQEYNLIERHQRESGIPVIFLSELKPFLFKDLFDHVKTMLRIEEKPLKIGRLHIDVQLKKVKIGDSIISLTKTEFKILYMLASNPLKPYSRQQIVDAVWKDSKGSVTEHSADMHIARLRKKLGQGSCCIFSRQGGFGYEFDPRMLMSDK